MPQQIRTSDGRYVQVAEGEWWDTRSTEIVPDAVVDEYMRLNGVGVVVVEVDDNDDPGEAGTSYLH